MLMMEREKREQKGDYDDEKMRMKFNDEDQDRREKKEREKERESTWFDGNGIDSNREVKIHWMLTRRQQQQDEHEVTC